MAIKVYIAAPSQLHGQASAAKGILFSKGMEVTSRWIEHPNLNSPDFNVQQQGALDDIADIEEADVILAFNPEDFRNSGTGGRHAELGAAIILKTPIVLVGARTNVFHYHPLVTFVEGEGDYVEAIERVVASAQ